MVTALFPIKGQPPHIGHVLTLVRIYDEYDKIEKFIERIEKYLQA